MTLQGAVDTLTAGEQARHPGSLAVEAYFDGWNQAVGHSPLTFPRYLDRREEREWRLGWADGRKAGPPPGPPPVVGEDREEVEVEPDDALDLDEDTPRRPDDELAPYPPVDGSQLCAQTDPEAWFPEKGVPARDAIRTCGRCHFLDDCRAYAVDRPELMGVWGGTTTKERQALRRPSTAVAA